MCSSNANTCLFVPWLDALINMRLGLQFSGNLLVACHQFSHFMVGLSVAEVQLGLEWMKPVHILPLVMSQIQIGQQALMLPIDALFMDQRSLIL